MARLELDLLGPLRIMLDGAAVTCIESNKVRALLAYLAVEAGHPQRRSALVGLLWPDVAERAARHNFRQALFNLRQALVERTDEPSFLLISGDTVTFDPQSHYVLDVRAFSDHLAACDTHLHRQLERCRSCMRHMEQAAALYRGGFLQQLFLDDSAAFEEWAHIIRERLHARALETLTHLAAFHAQRGAYARARDYALRQIELEPWREAAHRQLMSILNLDGQRDAALAQYERCRAVLADELGVEPAEETTALYQRIREGTHAPLSSAATQQSAHAALLPVPPTPLFGRETELAELAALLENPACRLITITGPGGIGKTRLALAAATEQAQTFPGGAVFVSLVSLGSPALLASTIMAALRVSIEAQHDPQDQLLAYLGDKVVLLVLDNFEHLMDGSGLVAEIMYGAPGVTLLVTSRERLALQGEWLFDLEGLSYPAGALPHNVGAYSAVQLFAQRARQVQRRFDLQQHAGDVVRICELVEGMPLALELAASAVRAYSCSAIAGGIVANLDILATRLRDIPPRHRSMWAALQHSWQLLSDDEQQVVRQLSVFRGGFAADAATQIAGASAGLLAVLIDKSLLRRDAHHDTEDQQHAAPRYTMHELVRQYAAQKLGDAGETENTRNLHLQYYLGLAEQADPQLHSTEQQLWLDRLNSEHDNLRAALDWSLESRDNEKAARLGGALARFWGMRGHLHEGRKRLEHVLAVLDRAMPDERSGIAICAKLLHGAGGLAWRQSELESARAFFEQTVQLSRTIDDTLLMSGALHSLATVASIQGDYERATSLLEECLARDRELGNTRGVAYALGSLADNALQQGSYAQARALYTESLVLHRERQDRHSIAVCLSNLGEVATQQGDKHQATLLIEEALSMFRELGGKQGTALCLINLGNLHVTDGAYEPARALYREAMSLQHILGAQEDIASTLSAFAALAMHAQELERATRLYAAAMTLREAIGVPASAAEATAFDADTAAARAQLGGAQFSAALAEGSAMSLAQAVRYAMNDE